MELFTLPPTPPPPKKKKKVGYFSLMASKNMPLDMSFILLKVFFFFYNKVFCVNPPPPIEALTSF
jgi:hypothetical protein